MSFLNFFCILFCCFAFFFFFSKSYFFIFNEFQSALNCFVFLSGDPGVYINAVVFPNTFETHIDVIKVGGIAL